MNLEELSIRAVDFKSLSDDGIHIPTFRRLNLVISRNNSGKSALLDLIQTYCTGTEAASSHYHRGRKSHLYLDRPLSAGLVKGIFPDGTAGGYIAGNHWQAIGQYLSVSRIEVEVGLGHATSFARLLPSAELSEVLPDGPRNKISNKGEFENRLMRLSENVGNPFSTLHVERLGAERDVRPESATTEISIKPNGDGLTTALSRVINSTEYDSSLVEVRLLGVINQILHPDIHISRIRTRQHADGRWELFLEDGEKGPVSLTNSGSGLKTIILVATLLDLLPRLGQYQVDKTIFLFEELENNLHPALQRRLIDYVDRAIGDVGCAFITTHSSVMIDALSSVDRSQVLHVSHFNHVSRVETAHTHLHRWRILDDLDVRASDLLQSNGIIWVEGPSDRIYLNRWIELATDGKLREGMHYQCVFYGGRLLSHLKASEPNTPDAGDLLEIFRVNRNALIIIDSDKKTKFSKINETKSRIKSEIESIGAWAWVTHGREIENYIPPAVFKRIDSRLYSGIGQYEEIESYVEHALKAESRSTFRSKTQFSELASSNWLKDDLTDHALSSSVERVLRMIRKWNGMM